MVNAETSLSPMPQSFRQRFLHIIPRGDDLVPSALPKLKEVFWSSGTHGMRHAQGHANLDHRGFFFIQNDARAAVSRASHPTLQHKFSAHTKYEP